MPTRKRAIEIHNEMLEDLGTLMHILNPTGVYRTYLETRLMVLHRRPRTRQSRRSIRAIRWLLANKYVA